MDTSAFVAALLTQYPHLAKYLLLAGLAMGVLSALANGALAILKLFGKGDSKAAVVLGHSLTLLLDLHSFYDRVVKPLLPGAAKVAIVFLVAATALFASTARAQVTDGPSGCFNLAPVHCGLAAAAASYSPVSGAFALQPMAGPAADVHFQKWMPGIAVMGGGYTDTQGHSGSRWSLAPFAALGDWAGLAKGLFVATAFSAPPDFPRSGFKGWTWRDDFQILVGGSPDLVALLQKLPFL